MTLYSYSDQIRFASCQSNKEGIQFPADFSSQSSTLGELWREITEPKHGNTFVSPSDLKNAILHCIAYVHFSQDQRCQLKKLAKDACKRGRADQLSDAEDIDQPSNGRQKSKCLLLLYYPLFILNIASLSTAFPTCKYQTQVINGELVKINCIDIILENGIPVTQPTSQTINAHLGTTVISSGATKDMYHISAYVQKQMLSLLLNGYFPSFQLEWRISLQNAFEHWGRTAHQFHRL